MLLILSLLTLMAGPALYQWVSRGGRLAASFDRGAIIVVAVLVLLTITPDMMNRIGIVAPLLVVAGYLFPVMLESLARKAVHAMHLASLLLALGGIALHGALDGAGLAGVEQATGGSGQGLASGLGWAIVLHRLGLGMMLWMIAEPAFGARWAWAVLIMVAVATVAGYGFSGPLQALSGERIVDIVQALILGTIVHGLIHRGHLRSPGHGH